MSGEFMIVTIILQWVYVLYMYNFYAIRYGNAMKQSGKAKNIRYENLRDDKNVLVMIPSLHIDYAKVWSIGWHMLIKIYVKINMSSLILGRIMVIRKWYIMINEQRDSIEENTIKSV